MLPSSAGGRGFHRWLGLSGPSLTWRRWPEWLSGIGLSLDTRGSLLLAAPWAGVIL